MTLTHRLIKSLGGYTQGEVDSIRRQAEQAARRKVAAENEPMYIRVRARTDELSAAQTLLGGSISDWVNLLLKCRLGGRLMHHAEIDERHGEISTSIRVVIKDGDGK